MAARRELQWTPIMDDNLRTMAAEGKLAAVIADVVGRSRNAVIGRARRIGAVFPGWDRLKSPTGKRPRKPRGVAVRKPAIEFRGPKVKYEEPPPEGAIKLMDLGPFTCRWPHGNRAPYLFCGAPKLFEEPYCPWHRKMATRPTRPMDRLPRGSTHHP